MWRTREAVQAAAPPAECTGRTDLLTFFSLGSVAPAAAKALHVDYSSPEHAKLYDALGKLKGAPACKQLFKAGEPEGRWDLLPLTRWPPHQYDFHAYTLDSVQRGLPLQPGAYSLQEADLGRPVGPDRVQLASTSPNAQPSASVPTAGAGGRGAAGQAQEAGAGRGKRTLGKRGRKAAAATDSMSVASDTTGDTTATYDTSSRRRRTDG